MLRNRRSPTTSRKSTERSSRTEMNTCNEGPSWVHTCARRIDDHVHVDVHITVGLGIDAELVIGPAPDIFCEIIQDEKNGEKNDEKSEETARF